MAHDRREEDDEEQLDRRRGEKYYVLSRSDLIKIIGEAAAAGVAAGGKAAVNDLITLLGRNTIRNVGLLLAACLAAGTAWVTDLIHIGHK